MKFKILGWALFVIFFTPAGQVCAEPALPSENLQELAKTLKTPKALTVYLQENFEFHEDQSLFNTTDYWQEPEEFLMRKKGDCEDYALFTQYVLAQNGIPAFVISFYGKNGFAHTVTVFKDGGSYHVINEDRLYTFQAASIEEALSRVEPRWTWGGLAEKRGSRGWMLQRISNPAF